MDANRQADSLHRLVKHAIDSGTARTVEEARSLFGGYRLAVEIPPTAAIDPVSQAALLTVVALGRRVFLGGVSVAGELTSRLDTPGVFGHTLAEAVTALGGHIGGAENIPTIVVGGERGDRRTGFCIRTAASGWRGGILPIHSELTPAAGPTMPLTGMLSAALAINEAYLFVSGGMQAAGRRVLGLSLWQPGTDVDWLSEDSTEPELSFLPAKLWLIGLGHLGQAYLWGVGLLPYPRPEDLHLLLQDTDSITASTESTSVLTNAKLLGQKKTRAMAAWAEDRGFRTSIYERTFDETFRRQGMEPGVALCGVDNALARRALDQVGFDLIVEAGLGRGHNDFRKMRLHTLPGPRPAAAIWSEERAVETLEDRPAYVQMMEEGILDQCGVTLLSGKAVGAPFVGATAATLALSEILRVLHGGGAYQMIDLDLLSVDQRVASVHPEDFGHLNPGFVELNPVR